MDLLTWFSRSAPGWVALIDSLIVAGRLPRSSPPMALLHRVQPGDELGETRVAHLKLFKKAVVCRHTGEKPNIHGVKETWLRAEEEGTAGMHL